MGSDPGRIGALNEKRARLLVASLVKSLDADSSCVGAVATDELVAFADSASRGFVLLLSPGPKAFGSAIIWAARSRIADLTLMVDPVAGPGDHARRASAFVSVTAVKAVDGTALAHADPSPLPPLADIPPGAVEVGIETLRSAGLDVVMDDGSVIGEYLGLEVARVLPTDDGGEIRVGVGAVDREANRVLHGDAAPVDLLTRVVAEVASHRFAGAEFHPLGQMARERWLLSCLVGDPSQLGLDELIPVSSSEPRRGLRNATPAAAIGPSPDGPVLVLTSTGSDLSVIGVMADLIVRETPVEVLLATTTPLLPPIAAALDQSVVPVTVIEVERDDQADVLASSELWAARRPLR